MSAVSDVSFSGDSVLWFTLTMGPYAVGRKKDSSSNTLHTAYIIDLQSTLRYIPTYKYIYTLHIPTTPSSDSQSPRDSPP